ncbi:MAG: hypothetical protein OXE84_14895 [Rhodobacteraceae bacterium]|nr:hypothetical protein [Paracoccaceae bacterium]MCY4196077.1 hypothetical protein [Paracoccaceae bacterium]
MTSVDLAAASLPAAMARTDFTVFSDNTNPIRLNREIACLGGGSGWIIAAAPG